MSDKLVFLVSGAEYRPPIVSQTFRERVRGHCDVVINGAIDAIYMQTDILIGYPDPEVTRRGAFFAGSIVRAFKPVNRNTQDVRPLPLANLYSDPPGC